MSVRTVDFIAELPLQVCEKILNHISPNELARLSQVSRCWERILQDHMKSKGYYQATVYKWPHDHITRFAARGEITKALSIFSRNNEASFRTFALSQVCLFLHLNNQNRLISVLFSRYPNQYIPLTVACATAYLKKESVEFHDFIWDHDRVYDRNEIRMAAVLFYTVQKRYAMAYNMAKSIETQNQIDVHINFKAINLIVSRVINNLEFDIAIQTLREIFPNDKLVYIYKVASVQYSRNQQFALALDCMNRYVRPRDDDLSDVDDCLCEVIYQMSLVGKYDQAKNIIESVPGDEKIQFTACIVQAAIEKLDLQVALDVFRSSIANIALDNQEIVSYVPVIVQLIEVLIYSESHFNDGVELYRTYYGVIGDESILTLEDSIINAYVDRGEYQRALDLADINDDEDVANVRAQIATRQAAFGNLAYAREALNNQNERGALTEIQVATVQSTSGIYLAHQERIVEAVQILENIPRRFAMQHQKLLLAIAEAELRRNNFEKALNLATQLQNNVTDEADMEVHFFAFDHFSKQLVDQLLLNNLVDLSLQFLENNHSRCDSKATRDKALLCTIAAAQKQELLRERAASLKNEAFGPLFPGDVPTPTIVES